MFKHNLKPAVVLWLVPLFFFLAACRTVSPEFEGIDSFGEADPETELAAEDEKQGPRHLPAPRYSLTELREMIDRLEDGRVDSFQQRRTRDDSRRQIMREVEEGMHLPDTYGRTVRITADETPLRLPPGPMEEIIEREVSLHLREAGLEELIMTLSEIEGLNIIADQALTVEQRVTVNFNQVPLKELLQYLARNMNIDFQIGRNVIWVTESVRPGIKPRLDTRIFNLRKGFIPESQDSGRADQTFAPTGGGGGNDLELVEVLEELLLEDSPEGSLLRFFPNRHLLLVRNSPENLRLAEDIIAEFDAVPRQVLIEARFLTVSQKDLNQLGIDIQEVAMRASVPSSIDSVTTTITNLAFSSIFPGFPEGADSPALSISGILGNYEYQATLRALYKLTDAETLSAPRLTLLNNQTAQIRRGSNFYYWEEWEVVTGTIISNGTEAEDVSRHAIQPVGRPTEIEQGITLRVKVSVGHDGQTVLMSLAPSIRNVDQLNFYGAGRFESIRRRDPEDPTGTTGNNDQVTASAGYFLPEVSESSVNTSVAVLSGETVVLGGILENRVQEELHKVPLLGDLPLVGSLFRRTRISREPRHLLIFVTARVVSSSGEFVEVRER